MKYENAQNLLPENVIELIQKYIEGGYLYIPIKDKNKKSWGEKTGFKKDLKKRLNGISPDRADGAILTVADKILNSTPIVSVGSNIEVKKAEKQEKTNKNFNEKTNLKQRLNFYKNG